MLRLPLDTPQASGPRRGRWRLDLMVILLVGLAAEAGHFSWQRGRSVISADAVQYIDNAEALLDGDRAPDFVFRKPGYSLILAAVALAFGNMGWAAVAVNHVCQGLLPATAYGLGRALHSRALGWAAAAVTLGRLQTVVFADRIMSESTCTLAMTVGLLALAHAAGGHRAGAWTAAAGFMLGAAWLIRSSAVPVIAAAAAWIAWQHRSAWKTAVVRIGFLLAPVVAFVLVECGLNGWVAGRFRPGTSTFGPAMMMRTVYTQRLALPDAPAARKMAALLPEREHQSAFRVHKLDAWVARHRFVQGGFGNEYQYDELAAAAAFEVIRGDRRRYLAGSVELAVRHLLRNGDGIVFAARPAVAEAPIIAPTSTDVSAGSTREDVAQAAWYAWWALPNRASAGALAVSARAEALADRPAPFGGGEPWATLRFVTMSPAVKSLAAAANRVTVLWPVLALIAWRWLSLERRLCGLLALAMALDAALVGLCMASIDSLPRLQSLWTAVDAPLSAAPLVAGAVAVWRRLRPPAACRDINVRELAALPERARL